MCNRITNLLRSVRGIDVTDGRTGSASGGRTGGMPLFEPLEHRQMMSVSMPGTGLPAFTGSGSGPYVPPRPSAITTIQLEML